MIDFIKKMCIKYRELISYAFFGVLTTLVNLGIFALLTKVFSVGETTLPANGIAFVVSVVFAYFTNRKWVFESKVVGFSGITKEFAVFFVARIFAGVLDLAFVYVAVDVLGGGELIWKLVSNVIVIIINFVISKLFVFKKKKVENHSEENSNK